MARQIQKRAPVAGDASQTSLRTSVADVIQLENWVEAGRRMWSKAATEEDADTARHLRRDATVCFTLDHQGSDEREQRALDAGVNEILRDKAPADERLPAYFQLLKDSPNRLAAAKERMLTRRAA